MASQVNKIRNLLDKLEKKDGLYSNFVSPDTGRFVGQHISLGALGDSFYELLLKSWLRSGKKDIQAYKM